MIDKQAAWETVRNFVENNLNLVVGARPDYESGLRDAAEALRPDSPLVYGDSAQFAQDGVLLDASTDERLELTKAALTGLCANQLFVEIGTKTRMTTKWTAKGLADAAVRIADQTMEALKREEAGTSPPVDVDHARRSQALEPSRDGNTV